MAASTPAGQINLTATGEQVVTAGPVVITFPFTYTAALTIAPFTEVLVPDRITAVSVSNENITFSTPPGTPPGITLTLGLLGPGIAWLLRSVIEPALDQIVDDAIRSQVTTQLGFSGSLPNTVTITLQTCSATATGLSIRAAVGGVAPILPARSSGLGCMLIAGLLAGGAALGGAAYHFWLA